MARFFLDFVIGPVLTDIRVNLLLIILVLEIANEIFVYYCKKI